MKIKFIFCFLLISFFCLDTQAQNIDFGPELGYRNMPTFKNGETQYYQPGYRLGFRLDYGIINHLSVSTGLFFTNNQRASSSTFGSTLGEQGPQGGIINIEDLLVLFLPMDAGIDLDFVSNVTVTESSMTSMKFMSFPILVKGDYKGFSATAGINIDRLSSVVTTTEINRDILLTQLIDVETIDLPLGLEFESLLPIPFEEGRTEEKTNFKSTNLGLTVGAGYRINDFDLNVLYHRGFSDYRNPTNAVTDPLSSISFNVAYLFSYKKLRGFQDRATGEML